MFGDKGKLPFTFTMFRPSPDEHVPDCLKHLEKYLLSDSEEEKKSLSAIIAKAPIAAKDVHSESLIDKLKIDISTTADIAQTLSKFLQNIYQTNKKLYSFFFARLYTMYSALPWFYNFFTPKGPVCYFERGILYRGAEDDPVLVFTQGFASKKGANIAFPKQLDAYIAAATYNRGISTSKSYILAQGYATPSILPNPNNLYLSSHTEFAYVYMIDATNIDPCVAIDIEQTLQTRKERLPVFVKQEVNFIKPIDPNLIVGCWKIRKRDKKVMDTFSNPNYRGTLKLPDTLITPKTETLSTKCIEDESKHEEESIDTITPKLKTTKEYCLTLIDNALTKKMLPETIKLIAGLQSQLEESSEDVEISSIICSFLQKLAPLDAKTYKFFFTEFSKIYQDSWLQKEFTPVGPIIYFTGGSILYRGTFDIPEIVFFDGLASKKGGRKYHFDGPLEKFATPKNSNNGISTSKDISVTISYADPFQIKLPRSLWLPEEENRFIYMIDTHDLEPYIAIDIEETAKLREKASTITRYEKEVNFIRPIPIEKIIGCWHLGGEGYKSTWYYNAGYKGKLSGEEIDALHADAVKTNPRFEIRRKITWEADSAKLTASTPK